MTIVSSQSLKCSITANFIHQFKAYNCCVVFVYVSVGLSLT